MGSRKLALISAPAGFGKTTLVSEWIDRCGRRVAWLSLDEGDNDPARFLSYLVAALQTIVAGIGEGLLAALQSSQLPPIESLLTTLLNEIATIQDKFLLILDDYHLIDSEPIDNALTFILEHQPPQMHLVIATREDPHLPLARHRTRGQLTELRAADLRFTFAETAEFLNRVMGLHLSTEDIVALETRTEGWIAGLQLAALSMHDRQDAASFIKSFTGSHRFVLDYLVEEVLLRQTEHIRRFLLQTSILDRLCGPLCNAITDQGDGKAMLEALERDNLFVIPLDDQRQWYRYHHLFVEVLRAFLDEAYGEQVPTLHRKASVWFEQNDLPGEAIHHALAAKDFERAADLIEGVWLGMDLSYQSAAWLVWAKALPEEVIRARPVLCVGFAWALLAIGEIEVSESRLRNAERWLDLPEKPSEHSSAGMVVVDKAEFHALPASIAAARAYRALALEDIPATKMYAIQVLELVPDDEIIHRTQATALLGMAEYAEGNLPAAEQQFLKFQALMWQADDTANAINITYILANILQVQGRLREAVSAYQQALQLAAKRGTPVFLGASDLYRGLSELLCEQGDLEGAMQHLRTAQQLGERGALTGWPHRLCVAQAHIKEAQGDLAGALALLDDAERQYVRNPLPDRSIGALKTRTWLRQGRVTEAMEWAREQSLSPDDALSYLREFEHLTLVRLLIARFVAEHSAGDLHAALGLLVRLLQAAEEGGRMGSVIEIKILQSLAHQAQGDQPCALAVLERALTLAEPEGYVRVFVDEGETMRRLLEKLSHIHDHPLIGYVNRLLAAFRQTEAATQKPALINLKPEVVEPLSERELEVLRLLRSELSGPEIARLLVVSLNTLRTHTKNIFAKLGVNNRRSAVHRAEELGLF
ncbi:LuxR C-terminal-related transcriptional regulator [Longilinea arvoryzae]|uniref:LuxR C-terminal-related transcriptional regulator n=1 Tax=Longilinea arvoryzae TaxID=360412 RepID=UPI00191C5987|nr:LuxR C-terminal-related transcriptional regulator [Longilinea arvoryzae]